MQAGKVAGDFSLLKGFSREGLDTRDLVVAERGGVKNDADFFGLRFGVEQGVEIGVGGKLAEREGTALRVAVGGTRALEADHFPSMLEQAFREADAHLAGREVGDTPDGVDGRQAGAAGDNSAGRLRHRGED